MEVRDPTEHIDQWKSYPPEITCYMATYGMQGPLPGADLENFKGGF